MEIEKSPPVGTSLNISADAPAQFAGGLAPRQPTLLRLFGKWASRGVLGRRLTLALMVAAALAGAATFLAIANVSRFGITQDTVLTLIVIDLGRENMAKQCMKYSWARLSYCCGDNWPSGLTAWPIW